MKIGLELQKPKYTDNKKTKNKLTGGEREIIKSFSFDFRVDDELVFADETQEKKILSSMIIDSLSN